MVLQQIIKNDINLQLFGEKDLFMVGALRQLGKYVAEVTNNL